jgi:hypothetical protein
MFRMNVVLPARMLAWVSAYSTHLHTSKAAIVRQAVDHYMKHLAQLQRVPSEERP